MLAHTIWANYMHRKRLGIRSPQNNAIDWGLFLVVDAKGRETYGLIRLFSLSDNLDTTDLIIPQ